MRRGNVSIVYDGDGNRVSETVGGATVSYLVADVNPTGYPQVIQERQDQFGSILKNYEWGLQLIAEGDLSQSPLHYYGMDGHGSVRYLTDASGTITDTYDYDAFGNLIAQTGATANNYLFAGEQFDPALGVYYNRARYFDQRLGRFWTADTYEGSQYDPVSLHKYTYASANPINQIDPTGKFGLVDAVATAQTVLTAVSQTLPGLTFALSFTFHSIAIGLLFTDEQFRNDVLAALGPAELPNLVNAEIEAAFEFGGASASALIRAVRGAQTTITLDLFGGAVSQIPGAINVDLRAQSGIVADVTALPFTDGRVDTIVGSGPRAPFLDESARVLKTGGRIYIYGTASNPFAKLPDEATLNSLQLRVIQDSGPLDPQFAGQAFLREDGSPVAGGDLSKIRTSILEKF